MTLKERVKGCFLGLVVGDALGGPLEFLQEEEIKRIHGGQVKEMVGGGWLGLRPGEYTDDSEMAIITCESLMERGSWDPEDVAKRFIKWYDSHPKDIGITTAKALSLIKCGLPWDQAGKQIYEQFKNSAGNGSLMRCAPVALWGYKLSEEKLIKISHECSVITHADPRCLWSCAALNLVIAFIFREAIEKTAVIQKVLPYIDDKEVIKTLKKAEDQNTKPKTSGFVLDTLEVAFHDFLYTTSFEEAVTQAVNRGGDADTQGAVVGALAGAYYGLRQIPERWLEKLSNFDKLKELVERLEDIIPKEASHVAVR